MPWSHFIQQQFDKVLLFVIGMTFLLAAMHRPQDSYLHDITVGVVSAIIALATNAAARAVGPSPPPMGTTNTSSVTTRSTSHDDAAAESAAAAAAAAAASASERT